MAVGYSAQCKACNSGRRADIDKRLLAGESTRAVSAWLATQGEKLTFQGLAGHRSSHLAVVAEARERSVAASTPAFEAAVTEVENSVTTLDRTAQLALEVAMAWKAKLSDCDEKPALAAVTLFTGCLREAREAAIAKHEILHGKQVNVDGHVSGLAELLGSAFGPETPGPVEE